MKEVITRGCYRWGLEPTPEALERMEAFAHFLIEKNRDMNLTAIVEPIEIARRHFLDCLVILTACEMKGKRIIDVGCGAGFPVMPLLCYDPSLDITALDSTGKRIAFIDDCCQKLGLHATTLTARAEEQARSNDMRQRFDIALSRAVAPLNILAELCLPFVKINGEFIPLKGGGARAEDELAAAHNAIETLGGKLEEIIPYDIPGLDSQHQLLLIRKLADTPNAYPRRFARITAQPL